MRDHTPSTDESRDAAPRTPAMVSAAPISAPERFAHVQGAIGNRALARQLLAREDVAKPAKPAKPAAVGTDADWSAAGPWGDKVRGLLEEHLTTKQIGSLLGELPAWIGQGASAGLTAAAGDKGVEAVRLTPAEADKLAKSLSTWGEKAAVKWLESKDGKAFMDKVRGFVGEYPKTFYWTIVGLVAAAIGVAVALYAAGKIDPPMLSKEIKLGKDWTLKGGIDLGKPQEQWFQSALLGVGWQASKRLSMNLGSTLGYKPGVKDAPDAYTLGGTYNFKLLDDTAKKSLLTLGLVGNYVFGPGSYGGSASLGVQDWLTSKYGFAFDPAKGWTHTGDLQLKGDGFGVGGNLVSGKDNTAFTFTGNADIVKEALKLKVKGVMNSAPEPGKVSDTLGGSLSGKAGGFDYSAAATWNLTDAQLSALTLHLGYTSKDETLKWLVDLAHSMKGDEQTQTGKAHLTAVIQDYVLRVDFQMKHMSDAWSGAGTASFAIPLWKSGVTVAPMLGAGYGVLDADRGAKDSWWGSVGAGVSFDQVPDLGLAMQWNQPFGGSGLPGFASIGLTGYLGKPEKKDKKK